MEENKKLIADHHENVIRLKVEYEGILDDYKYFRDKADQDILYMKIFWNRVVDMRIDNYDKIIDLEIFLLKLFIPILGVSFAAGVNIFGIDTYTLKYISFSIIILFGLFLAVTLIFRKRTVDSEQKRHKRELDSLEKAIINKKENLQSRIKQIREDVRLALKNEPNSE